MPHDDEADPPDIEDAMQEARKALKETLASSPFTTTEEITTPAPSESERRAEEREEALDSLQENIIQSPFTVTDDEDDPTNSATDDIADALEDTQEALTGNVETSAFTSDEEPEGDPVLQEVSVDVGDQPEFSFPSLRERAQEFEEVLREMEESVGATTLATPAFWEILDEQTDADIPRGGLTAPSMDDGGGPSPVQIIEETNPMLVVEKTPGEGEVETTTDPSEVERVTNESWTAALSQVRQLDNDLGALDEARLNLSGAQSSIAERVEQLQKDREALAEAIEEGGPNADQYAEAMEEVEAQTEAGVGLIETAEEKIETIKDRGEDLLSDRNAYRGEVKAMYKYALSDETGVSAEELSRTYRGYQLRSPNDVPFRPEEVRHVLSVMNTFSSRGQLPVSRDQVVERVTETWGHDLDRVQGAIQLLTITGAVWETGEGLRYSPLTGG